MESTPNPTPPPLARLRHTWAFVHVGEYIQAIHALVPSTVVAPFDEIVKILCLPHPIVEVDFPPFVDDFHLEMIVILNQEAFTFNLAHSPRFFPMTFRVWCMSFYNIILSNAFTSRFNLFF